MPIVPEIQVVWENGAMYFARLIPFVSQLVTGEIFQWSCNPGSKDVYKEHQKIKLQTDSLFLSLLPFLSGSHVATVIGPTCRAVSVRTTTIRIVLLAF